MPQTVRPGASEDINEVSLDEMEMALHSILVSLYFKRQLEIIAHARQCVFHTKIRALQIRDGINAAHGPLIHGVDATLECNNGKRHWSGNAK